MFSVVYIIAHYSHLAGAIQVQKYNYIMTYR